MSENASLESKHIPQNSGIAFIDVKFYDDDATQPLNNYHFINKLKEQCPDVIPMLATDVSYGIKDGFLWLKYEDHFFSTENPEEIPKFCICRMFTPRPLLYHAEAMGIRCFPSAESFARTTDKKLMLSFAAGLGIPCADTLFSLYDRADEKFKLDYPMIVKPANGIAGRKIRKVIDDSSRHYAEYVGVASNGYDNIIWQKCMPTGDDLRVYMFGDNVYCAILRRATTFKANISDNPEIEFFELEDLAESYPSAVEYSTQIASNIPGRELGFAAIDFLFEKDGTIVFNEINASNLGTQLIAPIKTNFARDYRIYIENRLLKSI